MHSSAAQPAGSTEAAAQITKPSPFSPVKIAACVAALVAVGLVAANFIILNVKDPSIPLSLKTPANRTGRHTLDKASTASHVTTSGNASSATTVASEVAEVERIALTARVRQFLLGTTQRKAVFAIGLTIVVALIILAIVWFTVIAPMSNSSAPPADTKPDDHGDVPPPDFRQVCIEHISNLWNNNHILFVFVAIFSVIAICFPFVGIWVSCRTAKLTAAGLSWSKHIRLVVAAIFAVATIAIPLSLYYAHSEWVWFYISPFGMISSFSAGPWVMGAFVAFVDLCFFIAAFNFSIRRCKAPIAGGGGPPNVIVSPHYIVQTVQDDGNSKRSMFKLVLVTICALGSLLWLLTAALNGGADPSRFNMPLEVCIPVSALSIAIFFASWIPALKDHGGGGKFYQCC